MTTTLTELIHRAQHGDLEASNALYDGTYGDLRRVAHARLRVQTRDTLLDTGAVVHELYIRFAASQLRFAGRVHFMRWAAQVMRSVIIDFTRRRLALRRGGSAAPTALQVEPAEEAAGPEQVLCIREALDLIATVDPRLTQVVEMRYYGGMSEPEIAASLGVTERTVRRDWQKARLLLRETLA